MDASIELSDSDSGETWTLLEHSPFKAAEVSHFEEYNITNRHGVDVDNDEDTDGISIISDSEAEPLEQSKSDRTDQNSENQHFISLNSELENTDFLNNMNKDFPENTNSSLKTYVHRRNKRLSTVLNIIVLGSVVTAAGVAIGHIWGVRNDCSVNQTSQSMNKILSNLYKLQEENAYLRSKLKEMILIHNIDIIKRKSGTETTSKKRNICKKVFEDSIYTKNPETPIKCVENKERTKIDEHLIETRNGRDFLNDIKRLHKSYKKSKHELDYDMSNSPEQETQILNDVEKEGKSIQKTNIEAVKLKGEFPQHIKPKMMSSNIYKSDPVVNTAIYIDSNKIDVIPELKINESNVIKNKENKYKKYRRDKDIMNEDVITKRSKYYKQWVERKKYGRKKPNKKQKRKNKYEKWEMKYYLKNYDDVSFMSSQETEYSTKKYDSNISNNDITINYQKDNKNEEKNNCYQKLEENLNKQDSLKDEVTESEVTWYDKRAYIGNEARKKLEYEMFGSTNMSNAGWYFRRMRRREQCRAKDTTYKKIKQ